MFSLQTNEHRVGVWPDNSKCYNNIRRWVFVSIYTKPKWKRAIVAGAEG